MCRASTQEGFEHLDAGDGLIQLCRLVQGIYARVSERHDLTPVHARLICVLAFGPRGMAELARCFGVEKATLTGLVDRAEQRGLVRRSPVPGDRRALHVTLTDTGLEAATAFHTEATEELNDLLSALPATDREQFRRSIAKIIAGRQARPMTEQSPSIGPESRNAPQLRSHRGSLARIDSAVRPTN
jgi:DNA-binding MarR family transcriptional regulator